jgi:hypothetical protein
MSPKTDEMVLEQLLSLWQREREHGHDLPAAALCPCRSSGQHGYAVHVLPKHPDLGNPSERGLLTGG